MDSATHIFKNFYVLINRVPSGINISFINISEDYELFRVNSKSTLIKINNRLGRVNYKIRLALLDAPYIYIQACLYLCLPGKIKEKDNQIVFINKTLCSEEELIYALEILDDEITALANSTKVVETYEFANFTIEYGKENLRFLGLSSKYELFRKKARRLLYKFNTILDKENCKISFDIVSVPEFYYRADYQSTFYLPGDNKREDNIFVYIPLGIQRETIINLLNRLDTFISDNIYDPKTDKVNLYKIF